MKYFIVPVMAAMTVLGQTPQFEVASIRPSAAPGEDHMNVGVHMDGAQVTCTYLNLKDYISAAFNMKLYQISGPDFIGSDRFDIAAKVPAGAKEGDIGPMLKDMLVRRFGMQYHMEKKDFPVYALVVTKGGLKAKETPKVAGESEEPKAAVNINAQGGRQGVHVNLGNGSYFGLADDKFVGRKLTMAQLADVLARFEDRPVVDMTDVKGSYDLDLDFTPEDYMAMLIRSGIAAGATMPPEALRLLDRSSGDSMRVAMEKVGLKLDARKAPIDVVVVDKMSKMPTEN